MIKLFVGRKGSGKTLQMVRSAQWFFRRGYKVYSNFPCWGYSPKSVPKNWFERVLNGLFPGRLIPVLSEFIYTEQLEDKLKATFEQKLPTLFLLDEAPVMYHSREWKNFDLDLIYAVNQSRKSNVHMFMSAQTYNGVDKQLRETADYVYICEKRLFKPIRVFVSLAVTQEFFKEELKSIFLKKYIKKRKIMFEGSAKRFYKYYDTGQVILPRRFFEKFPTLFPDPSLVSIGMIRTGSLGHKDIEPPL